MKNLKVIIDNTKTNLWWIIISIILNLNWIFNSKYQNWITIIGIIMSFITIFKIIKDWWNKKKFFQLIINSPLTLVNGSLGSGKTMLLTWIGLYIKNKPVYTNFPIKDKNIYIKGIKGFNFQQNEIKMPKDNAMVLFDETSLYLNGNDPKALNLTHSGLKPSFVLFRQFKLNVIFASQRINQNWIEYRELSDLVIIPKITRKPLKITKRSKFKLEILCFKDLDDYQIWKQNAVQMCAKGEKVKFKNNEFLNMYKFKVNIPSKMVELYDTHYLHFLKVEHNEKVSEKNEIMWKDYENYDMKLMKYLGMDNLIANMKTPTNQSIYKKQEKNKYENKK